MHKLSGNDKITKLENYAKKQNIFSAFQQIIQRIKIPFNKINTLKMFNVTKIFREIIIT